MKRSKKARTKLDQGDLESSRLELFVCDIGFFVTLLVRSRITFCVRILREQSSCNIPEPCSLKNRAVHKLGNTHAAKSSHGTWYVPRTFYAIATYAMCASGRVCPEEIVYRQFD